jgi:hypothetical protein
VVQKALGQCSNEGDVPLSSLPVHAALSSEGRPR